MLKKIAIEQAVGTRLAHDITEVRPQVFKGPAFRKGHLVCEADLCRLQKLGKNHLYILDLAEDEIHEDEAAQVLARSVAGKGLIWDDQPQEGKIKLTAAIDGLFSVDIPALAAFNMVDEVMCATLHSHTLVKKGNTVAALRAIPLVLKRSVVDRAAAIARQNGALLSVKLLRKATAGLVITGNEIFNGLIEDRFTPILTEKVRALGGEVGSVRMVPDHPGLIAEAIGKGLMRGCDLLMLTGGMSVDPDDVTRKGIADAGAQEIHYGSAVLPGAMFLTAHIGSVPLLGVPACGLYHRITVLDLVLPRILAGEKIGKAELALYGHGGLCRDCETCVYPHCPFGKGS